jgi:heterodisulfide reductase subunit A
MANIRNQCSWVHADRPEAATAKAKELVRMAVAKIALLKPLKESEFEIRQNALVLGGGLAGLTAAHTLAQQGLKPICWKEASGWEATPWAWPAPGTVKMSRSG